jgi:uncharacterized protein
VRRILIVSFFVLVALAGLTYWAVGRLMPPPAQAAELDPVQAERALAFLDLLDRGAYAEATELFSDFMREGLPPDKLREVWELLPQQIGPLTARGQPRGERIGETELVTVPLAFEKFTLDARISFAADGRMNGFRLVPAQTPPPPVTAAERVGERELPVGEGSDALPGTLRLPVGQGPFPAVVFVHGSGPHDRDQRSGPHSSFRDLAEALAARGIASLRYDKRSKVYPEQLARPDAGIDQETVDDAVAALDVLRARPEIDPARTFVLGHSLGAMMAPRILQRAPQAAGGILLAAPARPFQEVILEQVEYIAGLQEDPALADQVAAQLEALRAGRAAVDSLDDSVPDAQPLLLGLPAGYWRSLAGYDPVAVAAELPQPLLILQGGRDYQVTATGDLARWREGLEETGRVEIRLYPELNHLFLPGEGMARPEEYLQPGELDPRVAEDIAAWIGRH